jgi:hypothetical protein
VYVVLSGTGGRKKEGRMSIPIQNDLVIGGTLESAERQEEER